MPRDSHCPFRARFARAPPTPPSIVPKQGWNRFSRKLVNHGLMGRTGMVCRKVKQNILAALGQSAVQLHVIQNHVHPLGGNPKMRNFHVQKPPKTGIHTGMNVCGKLFLLVRGGKTSSARNKSFNFFANIQRKLPCLLQCDCGIYCGDAPSLFSKALIAPALAAVPEPFRILKRDLISRKRARSASADKAR